jgi:hypothetical protein
MTRLPTAEFNLLWWFKRRHHVTPFAFDVESIHIPPWLRFDRADLRRVFNSLGRLQRVVVVPDGRYRVVPNRLEAFYQRK